MDTAKRNSNHPAFKFLLAQSLEELKAKTSAHDAAWHLGDADWSVDQDTGEIECHVAISTFNNPTTVILRLPRAAGIAAKEKAVPCERYGHRIICRRPTPERKGTTT